MTTAVGRPFNTSAAKLGPDHPDLAVWEDRLGDAYSLVGLLERSLPHRLRTIELCSKGGVMSEAAAHLKACDVYVGMERFADAEAHGELLVIQAGNEPYYYKFRGLPGAR